MCYRPAVPRPATDARFERQPGVSSVLQRAICAILWRIHACIPLPAGASYTISSSSRHSMWRMPPPKLVLECIEHWRTTDARTVDQEALDESIRAFLSRVTVSALAHLHVRGIRTVWRARLAHRSGCTDLQPWPWTAHTSLLYPPSSKVGWQRCNQPGAQVLYCADPCERSAPGRGIELFSSAIGSATPSCRSSCRARNSQH